MSIEISALQKARASYQPKLPPALRSGAVVEVVELEKTTAVADAERIHELFPATYGSPRLEFKKNNGKTHGPVNVGVILSGGQAPGGHNVIAGLFDGLKSINKDSKLIGFLGGPSGLTDNKYIELTADIISNYRNTGGFDMIGSGRTKLEKAEQFEKGRENCERLGISALVIIGGDDSNTNACLLAEYYKSRNIPMQVIGCPKTIDGDLKNEQIETSFGFDTACRVYSELIGNIERDANSAKKYWHFIKLMGRSASHIALECGLQTHANVTLVSEEIAAKKMTVAQIVDGLAGAICARAERGWNFGVILIPEGLIEFIPEMKVLINELNDMLAHHQDDFQRLSTVEEKLGFIEGKLSDKLSHVFISLPKTIQMQLAMDRDPHGNVQVSLIETEKFLAELVAKKLKELAKEGKYKGKFTSQAHFMGYEGRCAAPSNYDADYCYSLGFTASALIGAGKTGYMSSVRNTTKTSDQWLAGGIPITMMMNMERRHGEDKPVIQKALVELDGAPFKELVKNREKWAIETDYVYPGPIQYFGPTEVCDQVTKTLSLEKAGK